MCVFRALELIQYIIREREPPPDCAAIATAAATALLFQVLTYCMYTWTYLLPVLQLRTGMNRKNTKQEQLISNYFLLIFGNDLTLL